MKNKPIVFILITAIVMVLFPPEIGRASCRERV